MCLCVCVFVLCGVCIVCVFFKCLCGVCVFGCVFLVVCVVFVLCVGLNLRVCGVCNI